MALFHAHFFSHTLGMQTQAEVIIPQNRSGKRPIGTLYLLHGMSDDQSIWARRTRIETYAEDANLAVVMPTTHLGWYTDMKNGWANYFTYVADELPAVMRSFFNGISDKREENFVAGLSMGGYGAMKIALARPDKFAAAGCFSSAFGAASRVVTNPDFGAVSYWRNMFGDNPVGGADDLFAEAARLAEAKITPPRLYIWCGAQDFLIEDNRSMHNRLTDLGIDHVYSESDGDHSWQYWDEQAKIFIEFIKKERQMKL